jgi:hypothetical protein
LGFKIFAAMAAGSKGEAPFVCELGSNVGDDYVDVGCRSSSAF